MASDSLVTMPERCSQTGASGSHISIHGLWKRYRQSDSITVLENIAIEIQAGEFVCILGESGCGKSTLLQIIGGFEKPDVGTVLIDESPVTGPNNRTGMVFQEPALLPWLTVEKNIALGLEIQKIAASKRPDIERLVQLMDLKGFERYYPSQLSGGMAQRVSIARALVGNPRVILFDEPFSSLDVFTRLRLQNELVNIWKRELFTAVFVTHDIDEAICLADRVVLMTPRPGSVARVFEVPENLPCERSNASFIRFRGMISEAFLDLVGSNGNE